MRCLQARRQQRRLCLRPSLSHQASSGRLARPGWRCQAVVRQQHPPALSNRQGLSSLHRVLELQISLLGRPMLLVAWCVG